MHCGFNLMVGNHPLLIPQVHPEFYLLGLAIDFRSIYVLHPLHLVKLLTTDFRDLQRRPTSPLRSSRGVTGHNIFTFE